MAGAVPVCSTAICLNLLLFLIGFGRVRADCTSGFSDPADFQTEGAQYLPVEPGSTRDGFQVIIPEMRFNCHGYITNWTALTVAKPTFKSLTHQLHFQIWRRIGEGRYQRIDDERIRVPNVDGGMEDEGNVFFQFENKAEEGNNRMYFQPGDILGYYIKTSVPTVQLLSIVFRNATPSDDPSVVVDMYSYHISADGEQQLCEISTCGENITRYPNVVPQISVNFETIDPASPTPAPPQYFCSSISFETCLAPSSTIVPSVPSSTPCPNGDCGSSSGTNSIMFLIAGVVAGSCLIILLSVIGIILICLRQRSRNLLYKRRKSFHTNPTYERPEDVVQLSPQLLRYQANNGALYTVPNRGATDEATAAFEEGDAFDDGGFYASTYQTNGQVHTYHELEQPNGEPLEGNFRRHASLPSRFHHPPFHLERHFSVAPRPMMERHPSLFPRKHRDQVTAVSQSTLTQSPPAIPQALLDQHRPSVSQVSFDKRRPSQFSQMTLSSVFSDPNRRPSTLSRGSTLVSQSSISQFPYSESETKARLDFMKEVTPPYHEVTTQEPQTDVLWRGSEYSLPQSQVRQLFHAMDEEGFRVPTVEERQEYHGSTVEEIYSKLQRPHSRSRDSRDTTFFEQAEIYWEPSKSTAELYNQLALRKFREIQRSHISVGVCLGTGHFGTVQKGEWQIPGGSMDVAVKMLRPDAPEDERVKLLQEAAIMGQFLHPNVVKLHGVVTVGEPLMIVLELMPKGDLKAFLRNFQKKLIPPDLPAVFLNFCRQISFGMNYLSNKAFVHRDLAARNIFLTDDLSCKIGDFGMARDLSGEDIYHSRGGKIPVKWTAPEALNYRKYSTASDVWSYGMLLFEIWSLGRKPFERISSQSKLINLISSGHCQAPPPGCPRAIYQLMVHCWHPVASHRPSFSEVCDHLSVSDEVLLSWTSSDQVVSNRVTELGASLSEARNLYPDLQYTYDTTS